MEYNSTLEYYNNNASEFTEGTVNADIKGICDIFVSYLKKDAYILDFGCGSGRDARYFSAIGYKVDALDGSQELCRTAYEKTGIKVRHMLFTEFDETDRYDGIWACASVLHLDSDTLQQVLGHMIKALHSSGIIYMSFKYGLTEGYRGERYFTDFTEESFSAFISGYNEIRTEKMWVTADARPGRSDEKWLNIILRKTQV